MVQGRSGTGPFEPPVPRRWGYDRGKTSKSDAIVLFSLARLSIMECMELL